MRYILLTIYFFSLIFAQSNEPQLAPLNPKFIKYQEDKKRGLIHKINSEGYYNSIIPHPTDCKIEISKNFKKPILFPARYDLRDEGFVTPVKDQGGCGSCWLFTSMGSIESYWKKLGLGIYDLSENHAGNEYGFDNEPCEGGNSKILTPYLVRGDGPISEADDPYSLGKEQYNPLFAPQGIVTEARFLPNDVDVIKQYITDYGGLYSFFLSFGDLYDHYNQTDNTYFYSSIDTDTTDWGHGIVLVGWDDNMETAGGTGAWIIKNSWGYNFGENGYFYYSYQDVFFNVEGEGWATCWPGRIDYNEHMTIYYYDKFGWIGNYGWGDGTDYALVKFVINTDETLTRVGTYINGTDATVKFEVYDTFNNNSLGNLLASTNTFNCDYPGYYSFDLPIPLAVDAGEEIYVKVKYSTPNFGYPIPVEEYNANWGWNFTPQIEAGCFWISNTGEQNTWFENGNNVTGRELDPCVKLYTIETAWVAVKDNITNSMEFKLDQNFPNPFNPSTTITFNISEEANVKISIYDMTGRLIRELINQRMIIGNKTINWDGKDDYGNSVSGGIYLYSLQTGDYSQTKKMVLMK